MAQLGGTVVLRTSGDPDPLAESVRDQLLRVDPTLTSPTLETLASLRSDSLVRSRFGSFRVSTFSLLATALAGCLVPALRAAGGDAVGALNGE